jgi:hypothetical protein
MPAAQTLSSAQQQQAALAPTIAQVISQGPAAVTRLLDTAGSTNPSVAADLLTMAGVATSASGPPATASAVTHGGRQPIAHAASCYPDESWTSNYNLDGAVIGWVYDNANSWCGNPNTHTITTPLSGEFNHSTWAWGPYCNTDINEEDGWDDYPSEMHSITAAELGVSYVFGCAGIRGYHSSLEIWASGVWNNNDDWGF